MDRIILEKHYIKYKEYLAEEDFLWIHKEFEALASDFQRQSYASMARLIRLHCQKAEVVDKGRKMIEEGLESLNKLEG